MGGRHGGRKIAPWKKQSKMGVDMKKTLENQGFF